ncbi:MAG: hypothetical protein HKN23_02275, partial [Verrucomicrobiales bacterium]|nr:hypothetical protein [Verrucomicrobiales bacterium]
MRIRIFSLAFAITFPSLLLSENVRKPVSDEDARKWIAVAIHHKFK